MHIKELLLLGAALLFYSSGVSAQDSNRTESFSFEAYEQLGLPKMLSQNEVPERKIRIAIIDDGFNLNHELLKPFIVSNEGEVPNNNFDDDANGYVDDELSWDVADNDNDVQIVKGREREFYHGTMVASIIATVFIQTYDSLAPNYLEILPVKAVANSDPKSYVKEGYKGIEYALTRDVDIICCAWSGGEPTKDQKYILQQAAAQEVMVIGSAGDHHRKVLNPAADPNVIAVSAMDAYGRLLPTANMGTELDFIARGDQVRAGHPLDERAYFYGSGTSASVALVSGVMGLTWSLFPKKSGQEIYDALLYSAQSLDGLNPKFIGKLGAGSMNASQAMLLLQNPDERFKGKSLQNSKGVMFFPAKSGGQSYQVNAPRDIYGYEFRIEAEAHKKDWVTVSSIDSSYDLKGDTPEFLKKQLVKGNRLTISNENAKNKKPFKVYYQVSVLDSASMYCDDIQYLYSPSQSLGDGSGVFQYSNQCDCKWIIRAPEGKRIQMEFKEMDTQANRDFVWVFEGNKTLEDNLIGKFSGSNKPPNVTSTSNEVMLWFLTDDSGTGDGWKLEYSFVD